MILGRVFRTPINAKDPTVRSWLNALDDARSRTVAALKGINPWDAIVEFMRNEHKLLIGEPSAERILIELGSVSLEQARVMSVKGRDMVSGLPAAVEVSSIEIQQVYNPNTSLPYMQWSSESDSRTIGSLLYSIAVNQLNWLYVGVLQEFPPKEIEVQFERDPEKLPAFIRDNTLAQHWQRLDAVRWQLNQAYQEMTLEDFQRTRMGPDTICSAEWVAHELCQFEAEKRVEIARLYAAAKQALNPETKTD